MAGQTADLNELVGFMLVCFAPFFFRSGASMKLTMPRFDQAPVLVVGDVMLDRYWHGGTSRISPEAPVPVVRSSRSRIGPVARPTWR